MSDSIINKVIKYLDNEASENDLKEVLEWKDNNQDEFESIRLIYENTPFEQKEFNPDVKREFVLGKVRAEYRLQPVGKRRILYYWLKAAAVFAGLIAIGITLVYYNNSLKHEYANISDQIQEIYLPDGSLISLDKNSTLTYKNDWLSRFTRKVNLSGRAFFQIEKELSNDFQVRTTNTIVEVLGTKFTVSDNFEKTQVILNEGEIRVTSDIVSESYLLTNPGEQLIILESGSVKQGVVNQNLYFSWLHEKLNFSNCYVSEALDFLADSYNIQIELKDSNALNKQLFGSAPSDNPRLIVEAIAKITNKEIEEYQKLIILE